MRRKAFANAQSILNNPGVRVIPQSRSPLLRHGLTDCISMQAMRREGIVEALTNDRHFEQEGFRALFRDS